MFNFTEIETLGETLSLALAEGDLDEALTLCRRREQLLRAVVPTELDSAGRARLIELLRQMLADTETLTRAVGNVREGLGREFNANRTTRRLIRAYG